MTLCIKTGMQPEKQVAQAYAAKDVTILSGIQTVATLKQNVPASCRAIISFGLCGGLRSQLPVVGQTLIASRLITPSAVYYPDLAWVKRLFAATHAYTQPWFSSGLFNTADTPAQRAQLYAQYGAWVIDDESNSVAEFANQAGISFAILRTVSDAADDDVPPAARNALNSDGSANIAEVIGSVVSDPGQIPDLIRIWREYNLSIAELGTAAIEVGPYFQWEEK